ncbi:M4 family metallopeptidase (plasmid) [Kitasatospora sp. NBC_00070]|uniref:M4 family metallopeptidase n=1 Tax=Kitasatospora sp. NBC_00070 TaxID=2975962 RepID=UPI002F915FE5
MRRSPRRIPAASAWIVGAALLAATLPAGTAFATTRTTAPAQDRAHPGTAQPLAGSRSVELSPGERSTLLAQAETDAPPTAQALQLDTRERLQPHSVLKDADGTRHTRYERTFNGLPVLGGDLVVHTAPDGSLKSVTKATQAPIAIASTKPAKTPESARDRAIGQAKAAGITNAKADPAHLVVWASTGTPVLAWESVVSGRQPDGTPSELHVITDAATSAVLFHYQAIDTGTGTGQYNGQVTIGTTQSGQSWTMTDAERGGQKTYDLNGGSSGTGTLFTDPDDTWGDGQQSNRQTAGVDAAFGTQMTWDYYRNVHGRTGIRDDGVGAYSRVHYGNAYVNAFWSDSCFCMTYGDGSGNTNPLTALDVAAHEMTHGVTAATAKLVYSSESGGLNEATSDIMAAAVEFDAGLTTDPGDYLVGEKINIFGDGKPLRYMDKPSKDGRSKDAWYAGIGSVDVHYSSGPANHWFYLASEGDGPKTVNGVSYDSPTSDGLPVTPIGREAAQQIWYRALAVYMTSTTNYAGARTATLQAAADLYGPNSATYRDTANAWAAINVGSRIVEGVSVTNPGPQTSLLGTPAALQIQAGSTNPGPLAYSAQGLPDGLSIDPSTGKVTGTPATLGTGTVTVTVTDPTNAASTTTFAWTVVATITTFENTTDVPIPDNGAAVYSDITVTQIDGNAPATLKVDVDIRHTWRGDLVVDLAAPDGTTYQLKGATSNDSDDDVIATYTVDASAVPANGVWRLKVQDIAAADTGYINSWKLTF